MITFYILLLIPFIFALIIKFVLHKSISFVEMFSMVTVTTLIISATYQAGVYGETHDTLIINGLVTSKAKERVSCRHSYQCHCHTRCSGFGETRSCSQICDTCYEHSFDNDWNAYTTIGTWTISTIDRQGLNGPLRWKDIKSGDPVSKTESYVNYVKAVPESLFNFNMKLVEDFKGGIPAYPIDIYDYYKINRIVLDGVNVPDVSQLNTDLSKVLGALGPTKQVNAVIVITKHKSAMYAKVLQASWIGAKKNDVIIVIGADEYPKIAWVSVFGWAKHDIFNVQLRDELKEIGVVDRTKIISAIYTNIQKNYVRKPMAEYEYLKDQIEPPMWVSILAIVLSLVSLGFMAFQFHKFDLWDKLFSKTRHYR